MGWTDLSTWDGNYQRLDFLNEYTSALNERIRAMYRQQWRFSYLPGSIGFQPGDVLVGPGWSYGITMLQGTVLKLLTYGWFVKHLDNNGQPISDLDGSANGLMYLNHWNLANAAPIFTGLPEATSFRRYRVHPSEGGQPLFGGITAGDIVGPWIFEDLQRAINLLVWTAQMGEWPTNQYPKARAGGGSTQAEAVTNFASAEEYDPGYGQTSWFNYYHRGLTSSFTIQSTRETLQARWPVTNNSGWTLPVGPGVSGLMDVYATPHYESPDSEFDPGGFGLHGSTWTRMQNDIPISPDDETVTANELGTTSYAPGSWPVAKTYRGYLPSGVGSYPRLLIRWNVPGGFEYVAE
ncbi:MAG: hypothetical protein ACYC26_15570 [Phycisphaerales bacterium]